MQFGMNPQAPKKQKPDMRLRRAISDWHLRNPRVPYEKSHWSDFENNPAFAGLSDQQLARAIHDRGQKILEQEKNRPPRNQDYFDEDPQRVREIFDFHHPESGIGAVTSNVAWNPGRGGTVNGMFMKDGQPAGEWQRELHYDKDGTGSAHHAMMKLHPGHQDNGFSSAWLNHLSDKYQQHGINQISLHANIDIGAYAWAKHGFVPDPHEHERMLHHWKNYLDDKWGAGDIDDNTLDRGKKAKHIREIADFDDGGIHHVHTLNHGIVNGHLGKAFLINHYGSRSSNEANHGEQGWHGVLSLNGTDPDYARGQSYRFNKLKSVVPQQPTQAPETATTSRLQFGQSSPTPSLNKAMKQQPGLCDYCRYVHQGEGWHTDTGDDARIHSECLKDDGPLAPFRRIADRIKQGIAL